MLADRKHSERLKFKRWSGLNLSEGWKSGQNTLVRSTFERHATRGTNRSLNWGIQVFYLFHGEKALTGVLFSNLQKIVTQQ